MARPRKEINKVEFEKLCGMQCTQEEILGWFDITDKTLTAWCKRTYRMSFSEIYAIKREKGKISLRRTQFKLADKSAAMAIFLGKQYLGQSDKVEQTVAMISDETRDQVSELLNGLNNEGASCPDS
jgi:hypothetical protein